MGGVRRVRLPAEVAPIFLLDVNAVVLRRLLDVGEGEVAIFVGDTLDLVEAGQGILDVSSVRQRLFALLGERVGAVGQLLPVLARELAMFSVRLPRGFGRHQTCPSCPRDFSCRDRITGHSYLRDGASSMPGT